MPACTRSAIALCTDCFPSDDIDAAARRTGFVKRRAQMTGTLFLALVTCGMWSDAKTTVAQWAAKVPPVGAQGEVSPEAMSQRRHQRALAVLQDMLWQTLTKVPSLATVCEEKLFTAFAKVYLADSTGCGLPESLQKTFPGSGGSAATAGAKMHAVWD